MSIISDNIAKLTAYPLFVAGSVDNQNIQKLRAFAVGDVRRSFPLAIYDSAGTQPLGRASIHSFASTQIP